MANYGYEEARQFVRSKIDNLDKGPRACLNKSVKSTAYKIGIDKVLEELCKYGGRVHQNFQKTNRYALSDDDIRLIVNGMKSKIVQDKEKFLVQVWK